MEKGQENKETQIMGMGASQARLLTLTSRKFDIGRQLRHCALVKESLTREMQAVSRKYNQDLQQKTLTWSNDGGVSYSNLSYATLMRPNTANGNTPVLVSNNAGKIVIDQKYKEYAEMISADGKAGGSWDDDPDKKNLILSKLTGIPVADLEKSDVTRNAVDSAYTAFEDAQDAMDEAEKAATDQCNAGQFAKYWGTVGGHNFSNPTGTINLGKSDVALTNLEQYVTKDIAQSMKPYLQEEEYQKFEKACKSYFDSISGHITSYDSNKDIKDNVDKAIGDLGIKNDEFQLKAESAILGIMSFYKANNADCVTKLDGVAEFVVANKGIESDEYKNYLAKVDICSAALEAYESAVNVDNQVLNAEQESKLEFYNLLFTAIADNGWVADYQVYDDEYLNQMLQNNEYYITTMTEYEPVCECDNNDDLWRGRSEYEYSLDLWSNNANIFAVNTESIRQEALTDYEYEKSLISAKEKRIDEKMQNLETEQDAITQMIQGIKQVENDYIERTMNLFT